jgi:hypothetical protein
MSSHAGFEDKANFVIVYEVMVAIPFVSFVIVVLVQTIQKIVSSQAPQILFRRCRSLCCLFRVQNYSQTRTTTDDDRVIRQTAVSISASDPNYGSINQLPNITVSK